ncbi:50S ribosomal protein L4 [Humisphaera borealis]|uniref:Large ribosomal subunit protein uL4 n=1 Tax=Humisphaera borealis TaxID=2807512 RepID=A0A7M2WRY7_9BACT|nr:50S ribosomal protein L4 [Humisphaera borealis]QOV88203.1 50S ribosomal protein L4 [Humisphaera borealis]
MIEVPVFNQNGQEIEKLQVDEAKLGGKINNALLKQAVVMYHANKRQGTVRTQARGEVAGSTRKMFKQKGTGNARTGGIRNPIKVGGGHAKQRRPKDWRQALPKKARRAARNAAILSKIESKEIRIIDDIKLDQPKTKLMAQIFKALGIERTCLFAVDGRNETIERSARNIDRTTLTTVAQLNAWDILKNRVLLVTKAGFQEILDGKKKEATV